ncbi:MAG: hypothetical protein J0I06_20480 [Planctomycetes bacterium]|nr:hypothetical protein [Planctomycetota bacterium]
MSTLSSSSDDRASTGRTLAGTAEARRKAGAREVHAASTHAVMAPGADDRIRTAGFGEVLTTDSVPVQSPAGFEAVAAARYWPVRCERVRRSET